MTIVTAAIILKDKNILIAKRAEGQKLAGKWEFPGGKLESGEEPKECLAREIKEEFNIVIDVGDFFGESTYEYSVGTIKLIAFFAKWISGEITLTVHDEYRLVTKNELAAFDFAPADIPFVKKLIHVMGE